MASVAPSPITPADRLTFTLVVALLLHAFLLFGVQFVQPMLRQPPMLEVTLVPTASAKAPRKADFIAQANQAGSGTAAEARLLAAPPTPRAGSQGAGRAPLPPRQAVQPSPAEMPRLASRAPAPEKQPATRPETHAEPDPSQAGDTLDAEIAALEARLSANREAQARRPRVRTLSAVSARADVWAAYIDDFRVKVETVGNRYYPPAARAARLTGQVRLLVAIGPDGRVRRIQRLQSSGHDLLDRAAEQSVWRSQPFRRFPPELQNEIDVLQVVRTWRFAEVLQTTQ